jgi:hypothetical protein
LLLIFCKKKKKKKKHTLHGRQVVLVAKLGERIDHLRVLESNVIVAGSFGTAKLTADSTFTSLAIGWRSSLAGLAGDCGVCCDSNNR